MTAYHLTFRHLDAAVLTATAALLEARTSGLPLPQAIAEYQLWADTAAAAYHLPPVTVQIGEPNSTGYGYAPAAALRLRRPSITNLLTGFRRHMQAHGATQVGATPDDDARGWAMSLYYTVRPRQFARLVTEGKIRCVTPADLLTPDPVGRIAHHTPADHGHGPATGSPAGDWRLQAARDFIRRAATDGLISADRRDRYLAMVDAEQRRATGPEALMEAIRDRAIGLYDDEEICHEALSDFLDAAGLDPHD